MHISLENIGKKFNREWIFKNLSHEFSLGDYYAILGSNGSGKSTLLKVLSGFSTPSKGTIYFSKKNIKQPIDEIYKDVAYTSPYIDIFEEYNLKETFDFYTKFKPLKGNISYHDFIQLIQLEKSQNKPLRQFSSGMKQRVKLGLAVLSDCPILLLDEPISNLDEKAINWYKDLVRDNIKDKIVFVASNAQETEYFFCNKSINIEVYK
jgi:ABC-type multidrug transport system ATPase subunit